MNIAKKIEISRREMDLSQQDLADAIKVNRATIIRYESGNVKRYDIKLLEKIAKATNKPSSLFTEESLIPETLLLLKSNGHFVLKDSSTPGDAPTLPWDRLFNHHSIEGDMLRIQWGGSDTKEFNNGDILEIECVKKAKIYGYYIVKDLKLKTVIITQIKGILSKDLQVIGIIKQLIRKY